MPIAPACLLPCMRHFYPCRHIYPCRLPRERVTLGAHSAGVWPQVAAADNTVSAAVPGMRGDERRARFAEGELLGEEQLMAPTLGAPGEEHGQNADANVAGREAGRPAALV